MLYITTWALFWNVKENGKIMTIYEFFTLLGGVGLFLYGMTVMSAGLRNACGKNLQKILEGATKNKVRAVLVGIGITVLVQSSSATDIMVIGFVNSGFMSLYQAIGVIMGANIGTTITAQITAFNLSDYAPFILFAGAVLAIFVKKPILKHIGSIILGFGMLFLGIAMMKSAIAPLAKSEAFVELVSGLSQPVLTVLFGVAFTAILQSSSSATVIFQAFAMEGIISYQTCVYLVIGSAIGSVTPNLLASLTTNRDGKRTAILNLIFNIFRAVFLMILIWIVPQILDWIQMLSPNSVGRQVANTHTIFAIVAVLVMLPFSNLIVKLALKIIKPQEDEMMEKESVQLHYMTNTEDVPPAIALKLGRQEIYRMGQISLTNLKMGVKYFFDPDEDTAKKILHYEDTVNNLDKAIIAKLSDIRISDLSSNDMNQIHTLTKVVSDIERISDYAENFLKYADQLKIDNMKFSAEAESEVKEIIDLCVQNVTLALEIFANKDFGKISEVERIERIVDKKEEAAVASHVARLMNDACNPNIGVVFTDMVTDLERCSDHALKIAYSIRKKK